MMENILLSSPLLGAVTRETTIPYLEEWISNFSKEPVGNGETAAWSRFTDFSQQSLELGMDSFIFFTLQTGKQMFCGRLELSYAKLDLRVNCSLFCMRNPTPPSWFRHWNKCTRTPPPIPPVPHVQNDKEVPLLALDLQTTPCPTVVSLCAAKGCWLAAWEKQAARCFWHAL